MAIKLKAGEGHVDLTTKVTSTVIEDGGYYIPTVKDGILSWEPSEQRMPDVPSADITGPQGEDGAPFTYDMFTEEQLESLKGPKGDKGDQGERGIDGEMGVHVGTEEPTDPQKLIWINPEGNATDTSELATKAYVDEAIAGVEAGDVDLSNYYNKEEVDNKLLTNAYVNAFIHVSEDEHIGEEPSPNQIYFVDATGELKVWNEVDQKWVIFKETDLTGYATEAFVTEAINTAFEGVKNAEDGVY